MKTASGIVLDQGIVAAHQLNYLSHLVMEVLQAGIIGLDLVHVQISKSPLSQLINTYIISWVLFKA